MSPCQRCGATNDPTSRFCVACGAPVAAARANPGVSSPEIAGTSQHSYAAPSQQPMPTHPQPSVASHQPMPTHPQPSVPSHQRAPGSAQFGANMGAFGIPPPSAELPFAETAAPLTREEWEARAQAEAAYQAHRPSPVAPAPVPRSSVPPPIPRSNAQAPVPPHAAAASGHPGGTAGAYAPQSHTSQPPPPIYGTTAAMPGIEQDPELVPERAPRVLAGFLVSYEVEALGRFWPIYQGRNRLGRKGSGTDLDIEIDHPTTSSRHALILAAACPGRLKLEDIGSTNGTLLNGVRITPGTRLELKDGDRVRFGLLSTIVKVV